MPPLAIASILMIASGSIHAIVNAIVKGGRDKMAGRALTDGSSAIILLPATLFVPWPTGAWGWLAASAVLHAFYLFALIRAYQVRSEEHTSELQSLMAHLVCRLLREKTTKLQLSTPTLDFR